MHIKKALCRQLAEGLKISCFPLHFIPRRFIIRPQDEQKGRAKGTAIPNAPMRENWPPTQQYITVPILIIRLFPSRIKGKAREVCLCMRCGTIMFRAAFVRLGGTHASPGGREDPTPEGWTARNRHTIM